MGSLKKKWENYLRGKGSILIVVKFLQVLLLINTSLMDMEKMILGYTFVLQKNVLQSLQ